MPQEFAALFPVARISLAIIAQRSVPFDHLHPLDADFRKFSGVTVDLARIECNLRNMMIGLSARPNLLLPTGSLAHLNCC
jgi:hypothetical protein